MAYIRSEAFYPQRGEAVMLGEMLDVLKDDRLEYLVAHLLVGAARTEHRYKAFVPNEEIPESATYVTFVRVGVINYNIFKLD